MDKDKTIIPFGDYCYDDNVCPFWDLNEDLAEEIGTTQGCGYCHYLEKGDYDIVNEMEFEKDTEPPEGFPTSALSLIWDQVKECGINRYEEIADCENCDHDIECQKCIANIRRQNEI